MAWPERVWLHMKAEFVGPLLLQRPIDIHVADADPTQGQMPEQPEPGPSPATFGHLQRVQCPQLCRSRSVCARYAADGLNYQRPRV
jgi:hypothetical protein